MSIHYDPDTRIVVTGSWDCDLRAWNVDSGECLAVMKGHTRCVRGVQMDDSKIISCSMDRTLRLWNLKTFECVRVISGHNDGVICLHFDDKSNICLLNLVLASGAVDGIIRVWNLSRGCSFTLIGHRAQINKVRILPCKTQLLSVSTDTTLKLWDIQSQSALKVFSGHKGAVLSLSLLKHSHALGGGRQAVTCSADHTVKRWDLQSGKCVTTLFGHEDAVTDVSVCTLRLISGSQDKSVKVDLYLFYRRFLILRVANVCTTLNVRIVSTVSF